MNSDLPEIDIMTESKKEFGESPEKKVGKVAARPKTERAKSNGRWNILRKYFFDPFVSSNNPPWFDARGIAVGLFVGFGIPIGAQLMCLGLLRGLFRYNMLMAFAFTWVNNPISVIPMYYGYYYLGSKLLGRPAIMSASDFQDLMSPIIHANYFWESVHSFLYLGWDFVIRWSVTALTIGLTTGVAGYAIGHYIQKEHCRRKAEELGITYEKLVDKLAQGMRTKSPPGT